MPPVRCLPVALVLGLVAGCSSERPGPTDFADAEDPDTYDIPPDELNRATGPGQHFGFPYVHGRLPDPLIGALAPPGLVEPQWEFKAHSASLGIKFYTGDMFPESFRNVAFIAEHGTEATTPVFGVRSRIHGDRISLARMDETGALESYEVFADGFLRDMNSNYTRRPVDLLVLPDGSLLISDDQAHMIYRVSYEGTTLPSRSVASQ